MGGGFVNTLNAPKITDKILEEWLDNNFKDAFYLDYKVYADESGLYFFAPINNGVKQHFYYF